MTTSVELDLPRFAPLGDWTKDAACVGKPAEWFDAFDHDNNVGRRYVLDQRRAASVCASCPVRTECALDAVRNEMSGVWGGYLFSGAGKRGVDLTSQSTAWWVDRVRADRSGREESA